MWEFDLCLSNVEDEKEENGKIIMVPLGYNAVVENAVDVSTTATSSNSLEGSDAVTALTNANRMIILKNKRALEMAMRPGQNLIMTGLMLWMSGGGLHIFSIMIVGMALWTPIKGLMTTNSYFSSLLVGETETSATKLDLTKPKLIYIAMNLAGLGVALYKCYGMGLLPLSSADWISLLEPKRNLEISGGGLSFV